MRDRQPDILIEVKYLNSGPVDAGFLCQSVQENNLGGRGGGNDPSLTMIDDCLANSGSRLFGSRLASKYLSSYIFNFI
jgi:hypothetical protein